MKFQIKILALLILSTFSLKSFSQAPVKLNAAEIKQALNKLEVLGSVLYVAAHPDDENTRLIGYMANEKNLRTAYMAMTRGDGGQNLVGTEIREYLGIIRTQELLAARRRDGGEQFFTRTNDFGFSKNPDETFNTWDKDDALADVVWNVRRFRPDIMITRFDSARVPGGRMHGHHTASSLLAIEAFDLANDPNAYPEQLKYVEPWQPKGLYWNTYNFRGNNSGSFSDQEGYYELDLGAYNPLLGKSYDEISAISRSQHKSQGFGSTGNRGELREYLKLWKGEAPKNDVFEKIDQTWSRVKGGEAIGKLISQANQAYNLENPAAIVPTLLQARSAIVNLKDEYWKNVKLKELDLVIKSAMGLYLEVAATTYSAVPGEMVPIYYEAINRSDVNAKILSIEIPSIKKTIRIDKSLVNNKRLRANDSIRITPDMEYSQPFWLVDEASLGMYQVNDQELIGLAENPGMITAHFKLEIDGKPYEYATDLVYKRNDRVKGEFYRPFVITPPVMADIKESVLVFPNNEPKTVNVVVKSGRTNVKGAVRLNLPAGWKSNPAFVSYDLKEKNQEFSAEFSVLPPSNPEEAYIGVQATYNGKSYDRGLKVIEYDHIPIQTIFPKSNTKVVRAEINRSNQYVGYIMGSGDAIPESLEQVGYTVTVLDPNNITAENLEPFDAVIVGVRAYNTIERMSVIQPRLMEYVKTGGTVITQYNTSMRNQPDIGPYPFQISRDRVTVEEAPVTILAPDHPIINGPNKITQKDFEGWVQERGLYFPNRWDDKYTPILSSNDPGETPKNGGLLVAEYGEGHFVYTGYSWFRELPAGVPGAFRIFTNMISLGKERPKNTALKSVETDNK
ncbi:PIG-L family deacetylase [Roseivirga misakiensis]|uniref:LmbE family protein n=1 Tax=Roseivirga misakiensis TaxID=1563681 RepID=A0A1E5SZF1_9BACT|nr:PIG-L family deacetylase [Roseivirga misakiensis]OEK04500.1 LmbE family protein [Roseivirga misakiensis]